MDTPISADTIREFASGNPEAFGQVYDAYVAKIHAYLYFRTYHRETAEDLTSDVFVKALKNARTFNPKRGTLQSWLYRIARNTVIDHVRVSRETVGLDDAHFFVDPQSLSAEVARRFDYERLNRALSELSSEQREIVMFRLWHGLSYAEIADITGKSVAAEKMAFSRVVAQLRATLPKELFLLFFLYASLASRN